MSGLVALSPPADIVASDLATRVAGFVGCTATVWPGRKSAAILLSGCNMRCPYCNCPEMLVTSRSTLSVDLVLERVVSSLGSVDSVVVGGGEPTLHPGLIPLLRRLRSHSVSVKIDTNGSSPDVIEALIAEHLVSFVAVDIKTTPDRYDSLTQCPGAWGRVRRSISHVIDSGIDHEFRTTCYPSALQTADLPHIARELEGGRRYVIQQFRPQRTLDPAASSVRPYAPEALRRAALCCAVHLPTVVRGV